MVKVLIVGVLLVVAQIIPSCGGASAPGDDQTGTGSQTQVIGWVEEKRTYPFEATPYVVVINLHEYSVPYDFWRTVQIGDLVKSDGITWTIVRRARR